jgi:sugar-specific transcriptional regulator TrmB
MNKLATALMALGLTEKEALLYLALYKLGEATAYQIAKESGVKRPTVYVIMEELRRRGLALTIPHAKRQLFVAKDPHEFIQEYQSKVNANTHDLLTLLPKLSHPNTETIVFKGEGALVQGLSYGLRTVKDKNIIAFYAAVPKSMRVGQEYPDHFDELYRLGFKLRSITPSNSYDRDFRESDKHYGFESRKIASTLFSPSISIEVCGDLTKTIIHKKREVIVLHDRGVADFYRQIFEMLWSK